LTKKNIQKKLGSPKQDKKNFKTKLQKNGLQKQTTKKSKKLKQQKNQAKKDKKIF